MRGLRTRVRWWIEGSTTPGLDALIADPDAVLRRASSVAREQAGRKRLYRVGLGHEEPDLFVKVFTLPGAYGVLAARAVACNTELHAVGAPRAELGLDGLSIWLEDGRALRAPVLGLHQATNLALAVRACELFVGRPLQSRELGALESLQLPARLERFGDIILDCAHTPDSARELRRTLVALWPGRPWVLVVSIAADKDAARILAELAPSARACVVTAAEPVRSLAPEVLLPLARAAGIEEVETQARPADALRRALKLAAPDELVVLTGSVYFAGAVRPLLVGVPKGV